MNASSATTAESSLAKPKLGYAWYVVIALTGIYMLSFVDRQILALLVGPMERDLHITDTQVGLLGGPAFALFYTFMGLPLGRLVDTRNRRSLITVFIVLWSVFTSSCSAAKSYATLFLARIGVGVGEAGLNPAAYSIISDYFPKDRMSAALSVYYMGLFLGSSLAAIVHGVTVQAVTQNPIMTVPLLGAIASWRVTFLIVGLPGVVFALLALTIREPVRKNLLRASDGGAAKLSFGQAFGQMGLRWQSVVGISLGMVFQGSSTYAITQWTPVFLQRAHAFSPTQADKVYASILILCGCSGMYVGGIIADRMQRRGVVDAPLRVAVAASAGMLIFLPAALTISDHSTSVALLGAGIFFDALPMGTMVAALQIIFPNQVRGFVGALFLFCLNLVGLNVGPVLPPLFSDKVFHNPKMIGDGMAITIGASAAIMLIVFALTMKPYRRHYALMENP